MKYKCLILDHDDTVMNSTATVHFPAFLAFMKIHRPDLRMSLEDYFRYNFEPGVVPLFRDICGLSEDEMRMEEAFWRAYVKEHIPLAYEGIRDILTAYKEAGGIICVVSHSFSDYILRDYAHNKLPEPDLVFGWELETARRKPSPWAVFEAEKRLGMKPEDMLVVDDLKPGYEMARSAGVKIAAALWSNDVPEINTFMIDNCDFAFKTVRKFGEFLL